MTTNKRNNELIEMLKGTFLPRNDPVLAWSRAISSMQLLPGLRGLWGMGSRDESGNVYDQSGQGRTLTNVSATQFGAYNHLIPYAIHDGSADLLRRNDEAGLDITGAFTLGGWYFVNDNTPAVYQSFMSKWIEATSQRTFELRVLSTGAVRGFVSSNGSAEVHVVGSNFVTGIWRHLVFRYTPSTELALYSNGALNQTETSSIPASIFNSTANFEIGASEVGTHVLSGGSALQFICAEALHATAIAALYATQKAIFSHH